MWETKNSSSVNVTKSKDKYEFFTSLTSKSIKAYLFG